MAAEIKKHRDSFIEINSDHLNSLRHNFFKSGFYYGQNIDHLTGLLPNSRDD